MKVLKEKELENISGGFLSAAKVLGVIGGVTFIIGVIDGFVRPLRCN